MPNLKLKYKYHYEDKRRRNNLKLTKKGRYL